MARWQGEFGFRLTLDSGYDFTGHSGLTMLIEKPDGSVVTKGASTDDASSGELYYTVEDGVLDQDGKFRAQGIIQFSGKKLYTRPVGFDVGRSLDA